LGSVKAGGEPERARKKGRYARWVKVKVRGPVSRRRMATDGTVAGEAKLAQGRGGDTVPCCKGDQRRCNSIANGSARGERSSQIELMEGSRARQVKKNTETMIRVVSKETRRGSGKSREFVHFSLPQNPKKGLTGRANHAARTTPNWKGGQAASGGGKTSDVRSYYLTLPVGDRRVDQNMRGGFRGRDQPGDVNAGQFSTDTLRGPLLRVMTKQKQRCGNA